MWLDPIVEEVRKRGDEYAAKFGYDLKAMGEDLRKKADLNPLKPIMKKEEGSSIEKCADMEDTSN